MRPRNSPLTQYNHNNVESDVSMIQDNGTAALYGNYFGDWMEKGGGILRKKKMSKNSDEQHNSDEQRTIRNDGERTKVLRRSRGQGRRLQILGDPMWMDGVMNSAPWENDFENMMREMKNFFTGVLFLLVVRSILVRCLRTRYRSHSMIE